MTIQSGLRAGIRRGIRSGLNPRTVPTDGPDGWYVPQSPADFANLGLATPDYLWLCQEASGNLSSSIGSLTLAANATGHIYEQSVTGWTRKFLGTDGTTAGQSWRTSSASLDLASGESVAMLALASFAMPASGTRSLMAVSGVGAEILFVAPTTGIVRPQHDTVTSSGTLDHSGIGTVHQFCWYRRGDIDESGAETDLESIAGTHNEEARAGNVKGIGTCSAHSPASARYGWVAIYKGTNANRDWSAYLATLRGE